MTCLRREPRNPDRMPICREGIRFVVNGAVKIDAKALFSSERNRGFALLAAIGAFMAMIGAFDTDGAAIEKRLVYWLSLMMFGGFLAASDRRYRREVPERKEATA